MPIPLPPGVSTAALDAALAAFGRVVGAEWVLATDQDRDVYLDPYALDGANHAPYAAVAPATVEEVQAILRLANEHRIPLWPVSRGKNLGYGGAAPRLKGSVVLDLTRMKKIEFDAENGVVLLEPGVGFYDLYDYIQARKLPFWLSVPGNSWGSVVGNALDRGGGATPYGDHASKICGMEVVLADGGLLRTGMGAMAGSPTWNLYRNGFGPSWDQMFAQSNFGVVTRLGLWLMPQPQAMLGVNLDVDQPEDLGWMVDAIAPLRREGLVQQTPVIGNWLRAASSTTTRADWYDKPGPLPDSVGEAIRARYKIGWWGMNLRLYGYPEVVEAAGKVVAARIASMGKTQIKLTRWAQGEPLEATPFVGRPTTASLEDAGWYGGRGGHIDFSPILPARGDLALAQFKRTYDRHREFGVDYHGAFGLGERHAINVNQLLFDKDDAGMRQRVGKLFEALVADAAAQRYGEYRTHIDYMDLVAATYDYNDHALLRLNEKVKDALDPNGVIAPGKSGVWPKAYAAERERL